MSEPRDLFFVRRGLVLRPAATHRSLRGSTAIVVMALIALARCGHGQVVAATPATQPSGGPDARPTVVLVVGAEGTAEYGVAFAGWLERWLAAAAKGDARVTVIGRGPEPKADAASDKEALRAAIVAEVGRPPATGPATAPAATRPAGGPPLWIVLIGHGTFDGREAKFNLRGPDVSAAELAEWLKPCRRPLAVIDCASSSAPFLNALSGPDRVIVTATRSGQEMQYSRFGDYLSAAVADPAADLDKDGQTSLLEAFVAAAWQTAAFYAQAGRLATEHPLLDDTGDGLGTPAEWFDGVRATRAAKDGSTPDGRRAHQWTLVPGEADRAMPAESRARRDELELQLQALRDRKAATPPAEYTAAVEKVLLELAKVYSPQAMPAAKH